MFYYPNVLQRHVGCFSTVWLAATKGTKIAKREYLKVNVINTCRKIIQYILQQVPPPYQGCPVPRLSLYLSAQLSYGVICVFHRQCDLLIEEMSGTLDRLHKSETLLKIDLLQADHSLLLPNGLVLMQMLEDAPDPFFGVMAASPELPDPMGIPQVRKLLETSPDIVRYERTPPKRRRRSPREESDHLASPEAITMREEKPILLPAGEIGPDIPEVSEFDLELLLSDLPTFPEAETLPEPPKREVPSDKREPTKEPKVPKKAKEPQGEKDLAEEERTLEIESKRRELGQLEKEVELLREEQKLLERQRELEKQKERTDEDTRKSQLLEAIQREEKALKEAKKELERLQMTGAAEELLLEKERQIKQLKELQKEREHQWEAEAIRQLQREEKKERERLQEREREKEQLREAEQTIEQLRQSLAGIEEEKRKAEESKRISEMTVPAEEPLFKPMSEASLSILYQKVAFLLVLPELSTAREGRRPIRHPGRRFKLIIDKEIQIESNALREQTGDPTIYTQPLPPVTLPYMMPRTPNSLLDSPTFEHFMAPGLTALWSRCAKLEPLKFIRERDEETMSEVVRAVTESGASIMLSSEFSLEVSEEERSRAILFTPVEGRSIQSIQEEHLLPIVSEMPDVSMEMPETTETLEADIQREDFWKIINTEMPHEDYHGPS
ncbi:meiotic recombination protein REC8 homolog [Gastrophryne carolinensis]